MSVIEGTQTLHTAGDLLRRRAGAALNRGAAAMAAEVEWVALDEPHGTPLDQALRVFSTFHRVLVVACYAIAVFFVVNAVLLVRARYRRDAVPPTSTERVRVDRATLRRAAAAHKNK